MHHPAVTLHAGAGGQDAYSHRHPTSHVCLIRDQGNLLLTKNKQLNKLQKTRYFHEFVPTDYWSGFHTKKTSATGNVKNKK